MRWRAVAITGGLWDSTGAGRDKRGHSNSRRSLTVRRPRHLRGRGNTTRSGGGACGHHGTWAGLRGGRGLHASCYGSGGGAPGGGKSAGRHGSGGVAQAEGRGPGGGMSRPAGRARAPRPVPARFPPRCPGRTGALCEPSRCRVVPARPSLRSQSSPRAPGSRTTPGWTGPAVHRDRDTLPPPCAAPAPFSAADS